MKKKLYMMDQKKDLMRSERRDLLKEEDEWKQRMKSLGYYDENLEKDRYYPCSI